MTDGLKLLFPADFPPLLREISDPPKQLYLRGELPNFEHKWLAVVGSRAMTTYGKQACRHLIEGLRGYPIVIVSGLAYGVDAEAHKTALDAGLTTVAVPGSGLDWNVLYPRANVELAREILKSGGALLSEFKPDQKATDYTFPQRNRIMAGLSHATLIIEAKEKSGSLITAKLVTEYNRELLVVPGSIFSAESKGTHQFLRLGATAVTSPEDILIALGIAKREGPMSLSELREDLSEDEQRVFEIIHSPVSRDELIAALELPITDANVLLSTMEIKGLIVEELGVVRIR
jgi:DNA processing protein